LQLANVKGEEYHASPDRLLQFSVFRCCRRDFINAPQPGGCLILLNRSSAPLKTSAGKRSPMSSDHPGIGAAAVPE
jgi:hypothetical protein